MATFNYFARKVVNPRLPIAARYLALGKCIRIFCWWTYPGYSGEIYNGLKGFDAHRAATRGRFNERFGFDGQPFPQPEQLVDAIAAVQVERNILDEARRASYRRRISQKIRGIRTPSHADREQERELYLSAIRKAEAITRG